MIMYPLFCVICLDEGADIPEWGTRLDSDNIRNIAATTVYEGTAYCTRHYRELAGYGTHVYMCRECQRDQCRHEWVNGVCRHCNDLQPLPPLP